ncbi:MAG: nucleotidyltransferase family protein [Clostridia bacterium]|nr:nucleotidyltransferase family protein [Clostridia bacterium]
MKTTAIICEYNPLHKGHEYAIRSAKKNSDDAVVAIMSSDFVQRGEAAVLPAVYRARAALAAGCDLVLELPVPYSFGSAEYFARAGVYIADAVGICDALLFGSEAGDINVLVGAYDRLCSEEFESKTREIEKNDRTLGHMQARFEAAKRLYGEDFAELISSSNNILALEYIKAVKSIDSTMKLCTVKREGSAYNDRHGNDGYVSATFLRDRIFADDDISAYVPDKCIEIYNEAKRSGMCGASLERADTAILSFFRMTDASVLSGFAEVSDGLEYRLCRAAGEASDLEEFFELAATKKYTNARIRRAVLSCMLGITECDLRATPAYVRAIAANEKGLELLKQAKKCSKLPVITNVSGFDMPGGAGEWGRGLAVRADALYSLMLPTRLPSGELFKQGIYIDKK